MALVFGRFCMQPSRSGCSYIALRRVVLIRVSSSWTSPLFAYRPAEEERFEDLTEDELELRKADVATHFYRYLQGMADRGQFIVIENHKSDQDVVTPYSNFQFTKNPSIGRAGLFV